MTLIGLVWRVCRNISLRTVWYDGWLQPRICELSRKSWKKIEKKMITIINMLRIRCTEIIWNLNEFLLRNTQKWIGEHQFSPSSMYTAAHKSHTSSIGNLNTLRSLVSVLFYQTCFSKVSIKRPVPSQKNSIVLFYLFTCLLSLLNILIWILWKSLY